VRVITRLEFEGRGAFTCGGGRGAGGDLREEKRGLILARIIETICKKFRINIFHLSLHFFT